MVYLLMMLSSIEIDWDLSSMSEYVLPVCTKNVRTVFFLEAIYFSYSIFSSSHLFVIFLFSLNTIYLSSDSIFGLFLFFVLPVCFQVLFFSCHLLPFSLLKVVLHFKVVVSQQAVRISIHEVYFLEFRHCRRIQYIDWVLRCYKRG